MIDSSVRMRPMPRAIRARAPAELASERGGRMACDDRASAHGAEGVPDPRYDPSVLPRSRGLAAAVAVALVATAIVARAQTPWCELDLGDGISVRRAAPFWSWEAVGFTFGFEPQLPFAATFARTTSGRIVAVAPLAHGRALGESGCEVLYTDDAGQHWSRSRWPTSGSWSAAVDCRLSRSRPRSAVGAARARDAAPIAMAFDPGSPRGVAVTRDGRIISTEDEAEHWRVRRTAQRGLVYAWVRGRTSVFLDASGGLWLSPDGGFALESLARPGARVEERGRELVVIESERPRMRIDALGSRHGL